MFFKEVDGRGKILTFATAGQATGYGGEDRESDQQKNERLRGQWATPLNNQETGPMSDPFK